MILTGNELFAVAVTEVLHEIGTGSGREPRESSPHMATNAILDWENSSTVVKR